jgi:hypothetical protein
MSGDLGATAATLAVLAEVRSPSELHGFRLALRVEVRD